jgi:hypothetical protein
MKTNAMRLFVLAGLVSLLSAVCPAQQIATGTPPFITYSDRGRCLWLASRLGCLVPRLSFPLFSAQFDPKA